MTTPWRRPDVDRYDALHRGVQESLAEEEIRHLAQLAHEDLQHRRRFIRMGLAGGGLYEIDHAVRVHRFAFWSLFLLVLGAMAYACSGCAGDVVAVFGIVFCIALTTILDVFMQRHRVASADPRVCEGCGYDIVNLPPAFDATVPYGAEFGPLACPECGRAWPGIPGFQAVVSGPGDAL